MSNIPFENSMLLVKETKLNKVGLVFVRAEGASRPVPVEMEARRIGEVVDIPGPSLWFTWWPEYGSPPYPGQWLDLQVTPLAHDEVFLSEEELEAKKHLAEAAILKAAVVLDTEGVPLFIDKKLRDILADISFLIMPREEYKAIFPFSSANVD